MRFAFWTVFIYLVSYYTSSGQDSYVLLVSFDGFRYDYVEKYNLVNFKAFRGDGASAERLIPCFPSMTFPNHYSIVTGMYPGTHGLVDNSFYDPVLDRLYSMRDRDAVTDTSFYGGIPIWQLARNAGLKTASYFWVGSEVKDQRSRPDYYYDYDGTVSSHVRIEKVISWLSLPVKDRPRLITLYFSSPDWESHMYGPWAAQTKKAVQKADSLLGDLMQRIRHTGLPVNVVLTSDHGLAEVTVSPDTFVYLDRIIDVNDTTFRLLNNGTHAHIYTRDANQTDSLFNILKRHEGRFDVYQKEDLPEAWHYRHPRVGDIFICARYPHYLRNTVGGFLRDGKPGSIRGIHGYDPGVNDDMHGIFYANGPDIRRGVRLPPIQNIDIYPLIARILGLTLPSIDGDPRVTEPVYKAR